MHATSRLAREMATFNRLGTRRKPIRPRSLERTVRRGHADLEQRGCLTRRPAEHIAGDERRTLLRRKYLHGRQERELNRLPLNDYSVRLVLAGRNLIE